MNQFAQALGNKFVENKESIRIRSFDFAGHTFKVKVPLTFEFELIQKNMDNVDENIINKYYQELSKELIENKDKAKLDNEIEFKDNDIIIKGKSLRDAAKNKALTEKRITTLFRFLVPEEKGFDMDSITYEMIEELFPFSIQMELITLIGDTISPNYKETRGK
ncbi:MAG: hypothetical protein WCI80_01275 [Bacteroidota bacterium]